MIRLAMLSVSISLLCSPPLRAEKPMMTPEQNFRMATNVIVGQVKAIYARKGKQGKWDYTYYVAEIMPQKTRSGAKRWTR